MREVPSVVEQENVHEPRECRVCGEPVTVVAVKSDRMVPTTELVRRCYNPRCRLNSGDRREVDRP